MKAEYRKITQALNYLAQKAGGSHGFDKTKAIKLLFFADRYHLRKYGRPVTGDVYLAMNRGPVGAFAKDAAELSSFLEKDEKDYVEKFISPSSSGQFNYCSVGDVESDVFSESDREALDFAIKTFGHLNQWDISKLSHAFPEWKKFEKEALEPGGRPAMSYDDFFLDAAELDPFLRQYMNGKDPFKSETVQLAHDIFNEAREAEKLWA